MKNKIQCVLITAIILLMLALRVNNGFSQSIIPPEQDNPALSTVDVLVVYTPQAGMKLTQGETTPQIYEAINLHNQILSNSKINSRINLIGVEEIPFDESQMNYEEKATAAEAFKLIRESMGIGSTLNFIEDSNRDDYGIKRLREQYGADLVSVWVELNGIESSSSQSSGLGYDEASEINFFSVIIAAKALSRFHFSHELGHNFGLDHDNAVLVNGKDGLGQRRAQSASGYILNSINKRTIMAYGSYCEDADNDGDQPGARDWNDCQRIPYFSNPEVEYLGIRTGLAEEDDDFYYVGANNARQYSITAELVAKYRLRNPSVDSDPSSYSYKKRGYVGVYGDVDGDGDDDLIRFRTVSQSRYYGDAFIQLWTQNGYQPGGRWIRDFCQGDVECDVGDFNGDGKDDLVRFNRSSRAVDIAISTGTHFEEPRRWYKPFGGEEGFYGVVDINGDHIDDILFLSPVFGNIIVAQSNGTEFGRARSRGSLRGSMNWNPAGPFIYDFDSDGDDDILVFYMSGNGKTRCIIAEAKGRNRFRYEELIQDGACRCK